MQASLRPPGTYDVVDDMTSPTMEDKKQPTPQPVVSPGDAWHLAQGQSFERAAKMVREAAQGQEVPGLDEFCEQLAVKLDSHSDGAFRTFLNRGDRTHFKSAGIRVQAEYDDTSAVPMVRWPDSDPDNTWGMVEPEDLGVMATPFREFSLERLPDGYRTVKLRDPHHAATAALVELLGCAKRDARTAFVAADHREAWRRLNRVIELYRQAAKFGISALGDDDYIGWRPTMPPDFEIATAAGLICRVAATARAQWSLATHLMAIWLQAIADSTEDPAVGDQRHVFLQRIERAADGLEKALDGMNRTLAEPHLADGDWSMMVIFRPVPTSIPVLALIPKPATSNVDALPVRRARKIR